VKFFLFISVFFFISACSITPNFSSSKNTNLYDGHAFDVVINNQKVVFLKNKAKIKPLLENYAGSSSSVLWKLSSPILGELSFDIEVVDNEKNYIGYIDKEQLRITVFPLTKSYLPSHVIEETHNDVLVGGSPLSTKINLLESMTLAKGKYVISIKVKGHKNWDRKEIYVEVLSDKSIQNTHKMASKKAWYALALGKFKAHIEGEMLLAKQEDSNFSQLNKKVQYYKEKRHYDKALIYQKKLTHLYRNVGGEKHIAVADMYNNLALIYKDKGEYEEALIHNEKSLNIKLKYYPNKHDAISTNYDNMGTIYHAMGEYALAIKYLKKSLSLREKYFPKNDPALADSYNNLSILFQTIGNEKEALNYLKKSLNIRKKNQGEFSEQVASIYSAMGSIYEEKKAYEKSLELHQKSLSILRKVSKNKKTNEALSSSYGGIATLLHKIGSFKNAISYYEKSLEIQKNISKKENLKMAQIYNNLAVSYMMSKKFDKSKYFFRKAIEIKEKILGKENNLVTQEYENLGWLYFNMKDYKKAFVYAKKSMDIFLKERDRYFPILNALENEHFIKNSEDKINLLFQVAYEIGDKKSYEESFSYWVQYKGSIFENENNIQRLFHTSEDESIKKDITQLLKDKRTLAKFYQQKQDKYSENFIEEHKSKISYLTQKLALKSSDFHLDFSTLVEKLESSELYIDFAKIGKHYFGFAINAKGEIFFRRISAKNTQEINSLIVSFRKNMSSKKILSRLYSLLVKTLLERLSTEESDLIISTNSLLSRLPFEALFIEDKNHYLIEEKNIRYISSAKEFLREKKDLKRTVSSKEIIVFSNPDFNTKTSSSTRGGNSRMFNMHFSQLEGTKEEARLIKEIMGSEKIVEYKGSMANEINFLKLKHPKILHVATHGFFIKGELSNPMLNAGIALSGANRSLKEGRGDGVVTALKLSGLDLEGTELVVLSACETGLVGLNSADSVSVLSKAFIQAGANAIVASLWSVSDEGTKDLMQLFYENIHKKEDYENALKKAKVEMIRNNISPAIWASFILHGGK